MSDEDLVVLLQLVEDGFNTDRLDLLDRILAPDIVCHVPFPIEPGAEAFKEALGAIRRAFPDSHVTIDDLAFGQDTIYRRWTLTGTHSGDFFGIPATGRRLEASGVDIERFENGRIVEHWSFWDRLHVLEQLGVAPQ